MNRPTRTPCRWDRRPNGRTPDFEPMRANTPVWATTQMFCQCGADVVIVHRIDTPCRCPECGDTAYWTPWDRGPRCPPEDRTVYGMRG